MDIKVIKGRHTYLPKTSDKNIYTVSQKNGEVSNVGNNIAKFNWISNSFAAGKIK